jgi:hypothetical protein
MNRFRLLHRTHLTHHRNWEKNAHLIELWQLADMYQLEGLKYACMGVLERDLCEEIASQILQEIEDLSCPCEGLKSLCHAHRR